MKGVIIVVLIALLYCVAANPRITGVEVHQTMEDYLLKNTPKFAELLQKNNTLLWELIVHAPNATGVTTTSNFTVFAPNDKAVDAAGKPSNLYETLFYHVHTGPEVGSPSIHNGDTLTTLFDTPGLSNNSQVLSFTRKDENATIYINQGQASIVTADILATNGLIHVIDSVISIPTQKIFTPFSDSKDFSDLNGLINATKHYILGASRGTFLAPTNNAWENLYKQQPALEKYFNSGFDSARRDLVSILEDHIVETVFYADSIANGSTTRYNSTVAQPIYVHRNSSNGAVTIRFSEGGKDVSTVTIPNIIAENGVSHGIDQVLLRSGLGIMTFSDALRVLNCTNFLKRLNETNKDYIIDDSHPNTYYIPTNQVAGVLNLNADEILYYATPGQIDFSDVAFYTPSLLNLSTLNNQPQQLLLDHVVVNNVTVYRVNGHAVVSPIPTYTERGSRIYTITDLNVLPGRTLDVLSAKSSSDNFTAFTELYTLPNVTNQGKPYNIDNRTSTTLFVPTNAAFSKLPLGVVGFLRMPTNVSIDYAVQILNNHIVPDTLLYNVRSEVTLRSADGHSLHLKPLANERVTLNNVINVVPTPLLTENGAVFSIDEVLLPSIEHVQFTALDILQGLAYENTTGPSLGKYDQSLSHYELTGYNPLLTENRPFTLFVATDAAWDNAATTYADANNKSAESVLAQLKDLMSYTIVFEDLGQLNMSQVYHPYGNSNITLTVSQAGHDEKTKVTLKNHVGTYEATVVMHTNTSYGQQIYGLDRVLGIDTKSDSGSHKLPVWAWIVIIVGGILVGLLLLAVIVGAAWYLFVRPNREGYRHIN